MSYPVTHLALTVEDADMLRGWHASGEDAAVLARVRELTASSAEQLSLHQAWEPIRRCLVGCHAVGAGQSVFGRRDYIIGLLDAGEAAATAAALDEVAQPWFRERFFALPAHGYEGRTAEADFDYTWHWFELMRAFFRKTADEGRQLIFTADQ